MQLPDLSASLSIVLGAAAAPVLAWGQSTSPGPAAGPIAGRGHQAVVTIENLGIEGRPGGLHRFLTASGHVFLTSEEKQGGIDLNGDGDTLDHVAQHFDAASGTVTNLGLAAVPVSDFISWTAPVASSGPHVVVRVSELAQGGLDLNGDGDLDDEVWHVHDLATGTLTNTGLSATIIARLAPGSFLLAVDEETQGAGDLNGDGDELDLVAHHVDLATGAVQNLGLAHASTQGVSGDEVLWNVRVGELAQGRDLDGDGVLSVQVDHLFDPATGVVTNLGPSGRSVLSVSGGWVAVLRDEAAVGVDLNLDGDTVDEVAEIWNPAAGLNHRTELASTGASLDYDFVQGGVNFEGQHALVQVLEWDQGADLNGDGDFFDRVLSSVSLASGNVANLAVPAVAVDDTFPIVPFGLTSLSESQQGVDLNGDGDLADAVWHALEPATGAVSNLGLARVRFNNFIEAGSQALTGFAVSESLQGDVDLNGDGDTDDHVWHVYEPESGKLTNLGLSFGFAFSETRTFHAGEDFFVFPAAEWASGGVDLNGNNRLADNVLQVYHAKTGRVTNTGLTVRSAGTLQGRTLIVGVPEWVEPKSDFNGDGDEVDVVVHAVRIP